MTVSVSGGGGGGGIDMNSPSQLSKERETQENRALESGGKKLKFKHNKNLILLWLLHERAFIYIIFVHSAMHSVGWNKESDLLVRQ